MPSFARAAIIASALAASACNKSPKGNTPVPDMDPSSPQSWKDAEAIAGKVAFGKLEKRSDALPFMFMADMPPAVLVHQGRVVTEKGAAAAGSYLRDLGIVDGKGPGIDDVLFVLYAFKAWPPVTEVPEQAYVNNDHPSLADVTARIEHDTDVARVVLHYILPEPEPAPEDLENDVGAPDPENPPEEVTRVIRATLEIPRTGEPAWKPLERRSR